MTGRRAGRSAGGSTAHAVRVAGLATGLLAVLYLVVVGVFDVVVLHRLVVQTDGRLADRLQDVVHHPQEAPGTVALPAPGLRPDRADTDIDAAPVFLWRVSSTGTVVSADVGAPRLAASAWSRSGGLRTSTLGSSPFRLEAVPFQGGWLVAGLSLADERHVRDLLLTGEAVAGPLVLIVMFFGSFLIGAKASAPVEQARQRQLEFTADASHELRTPLSVIEAEVGLALGRRRDAEEYRQALERVGHEGERLRRIVEDLLWLARFDSTPPPPAGEPIDVGTVAEACAERFTPVAATRGLALTVDHVGEEAAWVQAPADWIDRLVGVLVDNACRYTPDGGAVRVVVGAAGGRVSLAVEDSGPGVDPEDRPRLFDRFHRMSPDPEGTGLGLAIADSVVRSTGGRWEVGEAGLGGARFEVTWHRPRPSVVEVRGGAEPGPDPGEQEDAQGDPRRHARRQHPLAKPGAGNL